MRSPGRDRSARQRSEDYERASLSSWATLAADSKGRERAESPDPLRTTFQQDRDRVLAADAFQRLGDKSQTVLAAGDRLGDPRGRVRLAHALQVAQVGRTLARALHLNEDLVEAVALGHDLGHTAFAQAGEEALAAFGDAPFLHHEQSVRVVEVLERGGAGLNLSWEVRDGILHHPASMPPPATAEGQAVRLANRIALATGDLEAGLRAGIVAEAELPRALLAAVGQTAGERVATFVADAVAMSLDQPELRLSAHGDQLLADLDVVVARQVRGRPAARAEHDRAIHCLQSLVVYLLARPEALRELAGGMTSQAPGPVSRLPLGSIREAEPLEVRVLDVVSALTDGAALRAFARFLLPSGGPA